MPIKYKRYVTFLIISAVLFSIRIYLLSESPFADYDSIKNIIIAKEISQGNFDSLFQRRIPTVHLINALVYGISKNQIWLVYFHSMISTVAIVLFFYWISIKQKFNIRDTLLMSLIAGSSILLVSASRYMSIESWTLLLFLLFFRFYVTWLEERKNKDLIAAMIIFAIATTVNYKFIFLFPLFVLFELWLSTKYYNVKTLFYLGIILISPFLIYSLVGFFTGHGINRYLAGHAVTLFSQDHSLLKNEGSFNFDVLFYIRFILEFENPLLIIVLPWIIYLYRYELKNFKKKPGLMGFMILFTLVYLILISFIRKAPRGLIFIDLFLGYFFFLFVFTIVKNRLVYYFLLSVTFCFNILKINQEIYAYSSSSYPEVAKKIEDNKINKLLITSGLGIVPYLPDHVKWEVIFDEGRLEDLSNEGYTYALIDDYRIITGMEDFSINENGQVLFETKEKSLHSAILALEHAEFVRTGYKESMARSERIRENKANLILIRLD